MTLNKPWAYTVTQSVLSQRDFFLRTVNVDVLACHVSVKSIIKEKVKANLKPCQILTQRINYYMS